MKREWSLFALAVGAFGLGMNEFVMMGLLPDVAASLHATIPAAGYLIAAYALGVVIGAPLLTLALRSLSPRSALALLMGFFTLSNVFTALAPTFGLVFVARFLAGLPHGAFFGLGALLATRLASRGKEAQAMSIMFLGLTIANVVGVPIGTRLGQTLDWRSTFGVVAVVGVLATLSLMRWVPRLKPQPGKRISEELAVFRRGDLWLLIVATVCGTGSLFATYSYIAPLMTRVASVSSAAVPLVLILSGIGFTFGNLLGGRLADWSPLKSIFLLLGTLALLSALLSLTATIPVIAVLLLFLFSVAAFAIVNPAQLLLMKTAAGAEALGSAASQAAFNGGNALGAYLGGLPIAAGLGYAASPVVGVALTLGGILLAVGFQRLQRSQAPAPSGTLDLHPRP